jgi:hypothetical protein
MAWSWLRRRADRPSVPAPPATQQPAVAPVRPRDDWLELPAVQRTLKPLSPVAPLDVFTGNLAAHQNPSFLAPLGHRVDPDGPGGLVSGLASVRPGQPIPYADSSVLAVPAPKKPRPAVQRRSITWSTATPAESTESFPVDPDAAAPIEDTSEAEPASYEAESHPAATKDAASSPHPRAAAVDADVVTPAPTGERHVAPLLGTPETATVAATMEPTSNTESAETTAPAAPLTVSRLAQETVTAQPPAGRPVAAAQSGAADGRQPGVQPPTISSAATPAPGLQRQLAAVPEHRPRAAVFPPGFTVELPVVAAAEPEPSPAAAVPFDGSPPVELTAGHQQTRDLPTAPAPTIGLRTGDLPTAPASSPYRDPDPVPADPKRAAEQPESEALGAEPAEPTAPLSGFAARIAGLTHPPEDAPPPAAAAGPLAPHSVQRLVVGSAAPSQKPTAPAEPSGGQSGTPTLVSAHSPEPPVAPIVSGMTPLVQRTADHTADLSTDAASPPLPVAPSGSHEAGSPGRDLPLDPAFPATAPPPGSGRDLAAPAGGPIAAPDTALPVVARLTSTEQSPAAPRSTPWIPTGTAALVSHRPPLAVPADLSSAVAPSPAVQRVSYPAPGQPQVIRRGDAPAVVQRRPASPGTPAFDDVAENPVSVEVLRRTVTDEPPVVASVDTTGRGGRRMEPIPVQRRSVSTPATPLTTAAVGSASGNSAGMPPTIGQTRSFAAMFAGTSALESAGEAEEHPGYTTVQLQTATEPPPTSPPPEDQTAAPAAEPPVETAAPSPTAAAAAGAVAAAPTAGAAAADLDEMARRLFEPLSARLRAELWLDRERAGLVTDARY